MRRGSLLPSGAEVALVFCGGVAGTTARRGLDLAVERAGGTAGGWPVATLTVNLSGALLLGMLLEALVRHGHDERRRHAMRLLLGTGVLGAYTTYSTFAVDAAELVREDQLPAAIAYVLVSLVGGLLASGLGIAIAQRFVRRTTTDPRSEPGGDQPEDRP